MFYDLDKTLDENAQRNRITVHNTNVLRYASQGVILATGILGLVALVKNLTRS